MQKTRQKAQSQSRFTVRLHEIGTGISEASKRVPIFPFATQGGKQASSYFRQRNWVQAREKLVFIGTNSVTTALAVRRLPQPRTPLSLRFQIHSGGADN